MQGKMIILYADGTKTEKVYTGSTPELEDMQEAVDGWLEKINRKGMNRWLDGKQSVPFVAFMNEEGMLRGLPINKQASESFQMGIVGNVIVLTGDKEFMDAL